MGMPGINNGIFLIFLISSFYSFLQNVFPYATKIEAVISSKDRDVLTPVTACLPFQECVLHSTTPSDTYVEIHCT
jgi:hypothetical protein